MSEKPTLNENLVVQLPSYKINNINAIKDGIATQTKEVASFVVSPSNLAEAKKYRAEANKLLTSTDKKRVEVSKQFREPGNQLKHEVDAILEPLTDAVKELDSKIKGIEDDNKQAKRSKIYENDIVPIYESRGLDPALAAFNDKWLNKTYSHSRMVEEMAQYADIEKFKQERVGAFIHNGTIYNADGEDTFMKPKQMLISYYPDDKDVDNYLMKLKNNTNVISIEMQ